MTTKRKPYPMIDNKGGLNIALDPVLLADNESPYAKEVRYDKGLVKKDLGITSFESLPVIGTPMLKDTLYLTTGVTYDFLCTTKHLYKWDDTNKHWQCATFGANLSTCESSWVTGGAGSVVSHVAGIEGTNCTKIAIAAGFTTGMAARSADFGAVDCTTHLGAHLWLKSSIALSAGDLHLYCGETSAGASPDEDIALPALLANTWTRVYVAYAAAGSTRNATISVAIKVHVDKGACDIYVDHIRSVLPYTGDEDNRFCVAFMNNYAVITNGFDPIYTYDGSAVAALAGIVTAMRAKWLFTFMSRLVACGTQESGTDYPHRVRWSSVGTVDNWTTGTSGYTDLLDTVDWCTCGSILGPRGYVLKERSIWELQYVGGTSIFTPIMRVDGIGTLAPNSLANLGDELCFWGSDNVYTFDGLKVEPLAKKVYPWFYITGDKIVNNACVNRTPGIFIEELNEYWFALATQDNTLPDTLFKYNFDLSNWAVRYDTEYTCFGYWQSSQIWLLWSTFGGTWAAALGSWKKRTLPPDSPTTLIFDADGKTWEDDRSTSSTGEMIYDTKDFIWAHAVRLVECRVQARYGPFTVKHSVDGGVTWSTGTTFGYVGEFNEFVYRADTNVTTQRVRFRITCSGSAFELMWIEPWYVERLRSKQLTTS